RTCARRCHRIRHRAYPSRLHDDGGRPTRGGGDKGEVKERMELPAGTSTRTAATEHGPDRPVDPRCVLVWRWSAAIAFAPVVIAAAALAAITTHAGAPTLVPWAGWALLLAAATAYVWGYPPARHRRLRYRVDGVGITIHHGVLFRRWTALPRVRIQYTDV